MRERERGSEPDVALPWGSVVSSQGPGSHTPTPGHMRIRSDHSVSRQGKQGDAVPLAGPRGQEEEPMPTGAPVQWGRECELAGLRKEPVQLVV